MYYIKCICIYIYIYIMWWYDTNTNTASSCLMSYTYRNATTTLEASQWFLEVLWSHKSLHWVVPSHCEDFPNTTTIRGWIEVEMVVSLGWSCWGCSMLTGWVWVDFQAQPCPFEGPRYQAADPNPPELWQPGFRQPVMGSEKAHTFWNILDNGKNWKASNCKCFAIRERIFKAPL